MFVTRKYKCGYIHVHCPDNSSTEIVTVTVDLYAYNIRVKSYRAAQIMITKYYNKHFKKDGTK